ncbi:MAG: hypothetical protein SFV18_12000 [Bryobacteraceae bacterium]|jgi:hypothetical protein|nr:hypothetical protein [Bryobacteraceae bacterium]
MARLQIYLKVVIDTDENEDRPERLGAELCRQAEKVYGVRSAEVTNVVEED